MMIDLHVLHCVSLYLVFKLFLLALDIIKTLLTFNFNTFQTEQYRSFIAHHHPIACPAGQIMKVTSWCPGHYATTCSGIHSRLFFKEILTY